LFWLLQPPAPPTHSSVFGACCERAQNDRPCKRVHDRGPSSACRAQQLSTSQRLAVDQVERCSQPAKRVAVAKRGNDKAILRGAKPAELTVQFPTKFEMAVNLKTAKALGLAIPPSIRLRADEIIE
jgi:hypothetical protein